MPATSAVDVVVNVLVLVTGSLVGFVASRWMRRPQRAASAASVARNVGGTFGRRRNLSAPELQRACFSEMVRHVRVDRQGRTRAPARYMLLLHPDDLAVTDEARRWFTDGLAAALRQAAGDNGWSLDGEVEVEYRADPARRLGAPSARAVAPEATPAPLVTGSPAAPPRATARPSGSRQERARAVRSMVLVRGDTGERIPLVGTTVTVGRSRDCDITIDDTRVSRSHARFEAGREGWSILDEGSANGTQVANTELVPNQPRSLRTGDVIAIGPVDLRVTAGPAGGSGSEAGTRALDDRDRHRISGEVLPPDRDRGS